jgi:hypothetical protein
MIRLRNLLPYLLLLGVAFLFLPNLFRPGLFIDGLIYGTLSRNMADGYGTFWSPFFTHTVYYSFKEHPPLAFWIGQWAFKVFGDAYWVERIYSFIWLIIFLFIAFLFKKRLDSDGRQSAFWFPLSFLSIHAIVWSYQHNMLEIIFLPIAVLTHHLYLKSLDKNRILFNLLIGVLLLAALFTKGLVTLYPLAFPFWLAMFKLKVNIPRAIGDIIMQIIPIAVGAILIYTSIPAAKVHLDHYLVHQLLSSLKGERIVVRRTFVLERAAIESFIPVVLFLGALFVHYWKRWKDNPVKWTPWTSVWLAMGMSSILPICISPKQLAFYATPSLVYLCLFLLEIGRPMIRSLEGVRLPKIAKPAALGLLIVPLLLMITLSDVPLRDRQIQDELKEISKRTGENVFLGLNPKNEPAWMLKAYAYRLYRITLDTDIYKFKSYIGSERIEDVPSINITPDNHAIKLYQIEHSHLDRYSKRNPLEL